MTLLQVNMFFCADEHGWNTDESWASEDADMEINPFQRGT